MIDIRALNEQLVQQDHALRAVFAQAATSTDLDPATRILIQTMGEALAAIHERQGNLITLMLQTSG